MTETSTNESAKNKIQKQQKIIEKLKDQNKQLEDYILKNNKDIKEIEKEQHDEIKKIKDQNKKNEKKFKKKINNK